MALGLRIIAASGFESSCQLFTGFDRVNLWKGRIVRVVLKGFVEVGFCHKSFITVLLLNVF